MNPHENIEHVYIITHINIHDIEIYEENPEYFF